MFKVSKNILDLLFIKPCIKKYAAFLQVGLIFGVPHRYKPGAPEDVAFVSLFQLLNQTPASQYRHSLK